MQSSNRRYRNMKNQIVARIYISLLVVAQGLFTAQARAAVIERHYCAPTTLDQGKQLLQNYDGYVSLPGSDYKVRLLGNDLSLVRMIKSQSKAADHLPASTRKYVWIVMQPAMVDDAKLYPRFLMDCKINDLSDTSIRQRCTQVNTKQHFGLDVLVIDILAKSDSPRCKKGSVDFDVRIQIEGNKNDIGAIKSAVLKSAGLLEPLLSALFDEEAFFSNYFENLYEKWVKSL